MMHHPTKSHLRIRRHNNKIAFSVVASIRVGSVVRKTTLVTIGTAPEPVFVEVQGPIIGPREIRNRGAFLKFWRKARARVVNWQPELWPSIKRQIDAELPIRAQYFFFEYELMGEKLKATLEKKRLATSKHNLGITTELSAASRASNK